MKLLRLAIFSWASNSLKRDGSKTPRKVILAHPSF
jgi:hypothetical protein